MNLSDEARAALSHYTKHQASLEWIALDAFRIWYPQPYQNDDGSSGVEICSKEFKIIEPTV